MIDQKLVTEIKELASKIAETKEEKGFNIAGFTIYLSDFFFMGSKRETLRVSKGDKCVDMQLSVVSKLCEKEIIIILLWALNSPINATLLERDSNTIENIEAFGITKNEALSFISNRLLSNLSHNTTRVESLKRYI